MQHTIDVRSHSFNSESASLSAVYQHFDGSGLKTLFISMYKYVVIGIQMHSVSGLMTAADNASCDIIYQQKDKLK